MTILELETLRDLLTRFGEDFNVADHPKVAIRLAAVRQDVIGTLERGVDQDGAL